MQLSKQEEESGSRLSGYSRLCRGYIGTMEKEMETTVQVYGFGGLWV